MTESERSYRLDILIRLYETAERSHDKDLIAVASEQIKSLLQL